MHPELTTYIQTQLALGISQDIIINDLSAQGGWPLADIEAAFAGISPFGAAPASPQAILQMAMPESIKYFIGLMGLSFVFVGTILFALFGMGAAHEFSNSFSEVGFAPVLLIVLQGACVYQITFVRNDRAKIQLVLLFLCGLFIFGTGFIYGTDSLVRALLPLIPLITQLLAFHYLFSASANEWFGGAKATRQLQESRENSKWAKFIPGTNRNTLMGALALFIFVDTPILFAAPDLAAFWFEMLAVLVVFYGFYCYENYTARHFKLSESKLDVWVVSLVSLRNMVVILNFIPFIQILGIACIIFGGVPFLVAYAALIYFRYRAVPASAESV